MFIAFVLYSLFKNREMFLLNVRFYAKIIFISVLLIIILIGLIYQVIILEITLDSQDASLVFVLLNALLLNIYLNACFSAVVKNNNSFIKFGMLATVVYIAISSLGEMGFRIILNFELVIPLVLYAKIFESNTPEGTRFMFWNTPLFFYILVASILLEKKRKV